MSILWKDATDKSDYAGCVLDYPLYCNYGDTDRVEALVASMPEIGPPTFYRIPVGYLSYGCGAYNAKVKVDATPQVVEAYAAYRAARRQACLDEMAELDKLIVAAGKKVVVARGRKCKGEIFTIDRIYPGAYGPFVRYRGLPISIKNLDVILEDT